MRFLPRARTLITAVLLCALSPVPTFCAPNSKAMREALVAAYPLTKVGMAGLAQFDYSHVTQTGSGPRGQAPRHLRGHGQYPERHREH